jgi:hypothetical protein
VLERVQDYPIGSPTSVQSDPYCPAPAISPESAQSPGEVPNSPSQSPALEIVDLVSLSLEEASGASEDSEYAHFLYRESSK